ncbi:MAG: glycoside hydrolase family 3 N-terminal domain-containing protein [Sagittula sp.]|uniref:glycoside hydrolase family 3 N-terminal domain-containing protein n=1 Tax=Sagittula sp. TaxID=2038081 RepID=UPI004057FC70
MSRFGAAILGCAGLELTADEKALFREVRPFGFILFARNIKSADQVRALCDALRAAAGFDAPVFIDQEGGRVQRLRAPLAKEFRPPLEDVALGPRAFWLRARLIAHELRSMGIDGNCIPTLDVARDETHPILRNRCYGTDVETVVRHGRAVADGLFAGGVLPVMKHIPGHGLGTLDSHKDLPRVGAPRNVLDHTDFAAFRALNDLPLGMTAHLVFEEIDPQPATISEGMVKIIREEIGFDGLLMTDDISMEALSGTVRERGAAALAAGCDLVLHCNGAFDEMVSIWQRCGEMTPAAQTRAEAALAARRAPDDVDIAALEAEFDALTA